MASSHDFSALSWDEVLSKLREVEDLCAKFKKGFRYPPVDDHPSHDDPMNDDLPPLPLAIWASKHEADPNIILDLCTPSIRRTNCLRPSRRTPKFLCKRVSSMISPASFKRAQKIKTKLSFTRLVLSPSTIHSSVIAPRISALEDTADHDANVPPPVLSLNSTPAGFLLATSTSAPLLHDHVQCSSYTFIIRTILDGWIRPARNIGSNRLYSIRRGNCYFLLNPTSDSDNCYSVHTNSPLLSTTGPFQFTSDRPSPNLKFILSKFLTFFFYRQNRIPSHARRKYFNRLRQLLLTQRVTSLAHVTSRRLGLSYRKSYAFHHVLEDDSGSLSARTLISYSAHMSISHPTKKQLARQVRHKDLLSDRSKFSRHVVHPDLLDSFMWMATKDPAINIRNLVSSRPDVSFCLKERSPHSSVAFVSSKFTGSIQKVVLNPSSVVASHFITDKPTSGPFVGLNCPVIDYQDFKTLGFSRSIIDMVRRILLNSASIYVPSHNFLWLLISKHNTSSVSKKFLRDAIHSVITKSASSSTFSHLWNSDTRFSFKLGRVNLVIS
ncbi:unnamed protein product [Rhizophagus irregularis]|nr:unnamed protein product [Rhizophagus irregularis]